MKTGINRLIILFAAALCLTMVSCIFNDHNTLMDETMPIEGLHWAYVNPIKYDVKIDDIRSAYNLYLNLRVTADYRYSNIFVLVQQIGPDKKKRVIRYEFPLANKDGEWLGTGSGNFFNYQLALKTKYKFPQKGTYHISIEQNMRDNPLNEVSDVGLRVEKVE